MVSVLAEVLNEWPRIKALTGNIVLCFWEQDTLIYILLAPLSTLVQGMKKKVQSIHPGQVDSQSKTFVSCSGNIIKVKKFYKLGAES